MKKAAHTMHIEVKVTPLVAGGVEELRVWASARGRGTAAECAGALYRDIARRLASPGSLCIVAERVFGRLRDRRAVLKAREAALREAGVDPRGPMTYLECAPVDGPSPAGVEMTLVRLARGIEVKPLFDGRRLCGCRISRGRSARVYLSAMNGVGRAKPGAGKLQARRMFRRTAALLESAGMSFLDVACTRIYMRRLRDWYGAFNAVRSRFYRKAGLIGREHFTVPTSTGIQGRISPSCECVMDVFAVSNPSGRLGTRGRTARSPFVRLYNPLQNEATAYGSAFARGGRVDLPGASVVLLAGTASIDEAGRSVHVGDPAKQARRTMENFEAIAHAGGARIADLCEGAWYCENASYADVIRREMRRRRWPRLPFIFVVADVCRPDLLVEIDGVAIV